MSSGEFAAFVSELTSPDEQALLKGATLDEVLAVAAVRESERALAIAEDDEFETAITLRPISASGLVEDELDDDGEGTVG